MILFAFCTLLWLLTVYIVSNFSAVCTRRSDTYFFVMPKFLAIVASQWVWNISFHLVMYPIFISVGGFGVLKLISGFVGII